MIPMKVSIEAKPDGNPQSRAGINRLQAKQINKSMGSDSIDLALLIFDLSSR
jgi:hypothetical protein